MYDTIKPKFSTIQKSDLHYLSSIEQVFPFKRTYCGKLQLDLTVVSLMLNRNLRPNYATIM